MHASVPTRTPTCMFACGHVVFFLLSHVVYIDGTLVVDACMQACSRDACMQVHFILLNRVTNIVQYRACGMI